MTRDELLVDLAGRVLAMPEDRARTVAVTGMTAVGKSTLAADLAAVVEGAERPVVRVAYDDFHHPRERRYRQGRLSPEGYLEDAFDAASLRRLVLDPLASGADKVRVAAYDLAADVPVDVEPTDIGPASVVIVDGSFLLVPELADSWDLAVMVVGDPATVLDRAVIRDADLGTPAQVRELYVRRYFAAESLHEDRHDPWSHADVVVDLTDPQSPRPLR